MAYRHEYSWLLKTSREPMGASLNGLSAGTIRGFSKDRGNGRGQL
jgi:hypothetical protein